MTATAYRSGALAVPPTQNTAPVLEFNCLYTHDLRRKQKRWQDGFLRYHTFNKRVMLYDMPRNFIGDMHWKESLLQEGDEMTLEKSAVLVQVGEEVGRTETDLTELRKSTKKPRSEVRTSPVGRSAISPGPAAQNAGAPRQLLQMKHRSLNALLGCSRGFIGKSAMPAKSPYDLKHADTENQAWADGRPPKRQRVGLSGAADAEPLKTKESPLRTHRSDEASRSKQVLPQPSTVHKFIDLCNSDEDDQSEQFLPHVSSDGLQPVSSPVRPDRLFTKKQKQARSSSPALQTYDTSTPKTKHRSAQAVSQSRVRAVNSDTSQTRTTNRKEAAQRNQSNIGPRLCLAAPKISKKKLLCQDQLFGISRRSSPLEPDPREEPTDRTLEEVSLQAQRQRRQLEERLAKIDKKHLKRLALERSMAVENTMCDVSDDEPGRLAAEPLGQQTSHQGNMTEISTSERTTASQGSQRPWREVVDRESVTKASTRSSKADSLVTEVRHVEGAPSINQGHETNEAATMTAQPSKHREKRRIGAPMRFTPAPSVTEASSAAHGHLTELPAPAVHPIQDLVPMTRKLTKPTAGSTARISPQKLANLVPAEEATPTTLLDRPAHHPESPEAREEAVPPCPPDPWSREAFDLFRWRPPDWDEETWCAREGTSV
nr:hypothetical protein CFP56_53256 [Quercus suber]